MATMIRVKELSAAVKGWACSVGATVTDGLAVGDEEAAGVGVGEGTGVGEGSGFTVIVVVVAFMRLKSRLVAVMVWEPTVLRVMLKIRVPLTNALGLPCAGNSAAVSVELNSMPAP